MEINKATFTFDRMPEVVVKGQKQQFKDITVGDKTFKGVQLKDGTIARLKERADGKFDVKLMTADGQDLSQRRVRVEGGVLSRLRTKEGENVEKYDIPGERWKLHSGKSLRLDSKFAEEMTKGLQPLDPKIVIRLEKDAQEEEILITEKQSRDRSGAISRPKQKDPERDKDIRRSEDPIVIGQRSKRVMDQRSEFDRRRDEIISGSHPLPPPPKTEPQIPKKEKKE
jgi:hypothetical protein